MSDKSDESSTTSTDEQNKNKNETKGNDGDDGNNGTDGNAQEEGGEKQVKRKNAFIRVALPSFNLVSILPGNIDVASNKRFWFWSA